MKKEFKKTYAESGVEFQKTKMFSPVGIANKIFPLLKEGYLQEKMEEHNKIIQKDLWRYFEGCKKILDIGCGGGFFLENSPKGVQTLGIEIIDAEIEKCRKKGIKVIKADIKKRIPFKENSFDGVMMSHVIEHLENPQEIIEKVRRVLKSNGVFVILTPNFSADYRHFFDDPTHKKPFTKQSLFRILYDAGFRDIKIKNDIFHGNNGILSIFIFFPRLKFAIERIIGKIHSHYMAAVCRK